MKEWLCESQILDQIYSIKCYKCGQEYILFAHFVEEDASEDNYPQQFSNYCPFCGKKQFKKD